jgi:hypothetical protein
MSQTELDEFFHEERLAEEGRKLHASYAGASPFPHIALDDFFPAGPLREVAASVPPPGEAWVHRQRDVAVKWGLPDERAMNALTRRLIHELQAPPFLGFLEELSGIRGLIPDPYLLGGGIHQIERGGFLNIHADFNFHKKLRLHRRINVLLFLNEDWREEWGGHLELWDRKMESCVRSLLPSFNRCVIFNITDWSYHGHPHPLTAPEGVTRRSIALYYYSAERPPEELTSPHGVLYQQPGILPEELAPRATPTKEASAAREPAPSGLRGIIRRLRPF